MFQDEEAQELPLSRLSGEQVWYIIVSQNCVAYEVELGHHQKIDLKDGRDFVGWILLEKIRENAKK